MPALISEARDRARTTGGVPTAVLTFEPHPRNVFMPGSEPFRLTPFRVKEREIARLGVDFLFIQHFDPAFAQKSAESFIDEVLLSGAIGVTPYRRRPRLHLRQPPPLRLPRCCAPPGPSHGFGVTVIEPVCGPDSAAYSSTHIRELLKAGKPREAAAQLGRFWEIDGRVALGDQRGRTIGFPTANLGLGEYLRPALGVYAVRVAGDGPDDAFAGRTIDGVANLGLRPTVGSPEPRLEAHLFDIDADLYGRHLRVSLVDFIRPERKFSGLDALDRRGRQKAPGDSAEGNGGAEPVHSS